MRVDDQKTGKLSATSGDFAVANATKPTAANTTGGFGSSTPNATFRET